jgi:metallo-beta-lactamase class B
LKPKFCGFNQDSLQSADLHGIHRCGRKQNGLPVIHPSEMQSIYFLGRESEDVRRYYSIEEGTRMKRILTMTSTCAMAVALSGGLAKAQPVNEPVSKTCREGPRERETEIQKIEPFKVFDNLYHVGPCYVSAWILTTPQGDIMFDSAQEPFVDKVIDNIKKVGVKLGDIKYIIINHGHIDHAGGAARLKEFTGARVVAAPEDWSMIEALNGRPNNRDAGKATVTPKRDMEVREGDHLDLGDQHLIIHTAPGHTPGNLFIEGLLLKDGTQTYKGIWGGGGVGAPGLEGAKQGVINAQKLMAVRGVQVYLMTHSWQPPDGYPGGGILERAKLLAARKPGDPHPFVDPASWEARAKQSLETAQKVLAQEQAKAAAAQ